MLQLNKWFGRVVKIFADGCGFVLRMRSFRLGNDTDNVQGLRGEYGISFSEAFMARRWILPVTREDLVSLVNP